MSRERYIRDIFTGEWRWTRDDGPRRISFGAPGEGRRRQGIHVIKDMEPYRSPATGEIIRGRRQHRDHLRAHGFEEVGTEYPKQLPRRALPPAALDIKIEMQKRGLIG